MAVSWTRHRFSGGVLALDTANTVVHRRDPARRFDRFEDRTEIARFASAASGFCASETGGCALVAGEDAAAWSRVLAIREATDALFRPAAASGMLEGPAVTALLQACAGGLQAYSGSIGAKGHSLRVGGETAPFEAALALSAMSLLTGDAIKRLRICPNCGWLFVDRSRNASRVWCDMAVCGNRNKARLHYSRRKSADGSEAGHA